MRRLLSLVLVLTLLLPCFGAYSAEEPLPPYYSPPSTDAPLLLRGQEVLELYSFDYQNRAYHRVTGAADIASLAKALAVLPASKGTAQTTVSDGARGFLAFLKDGTRLVWYVTSKELSDDIGVIPSTQNARDTLLNLAGKLNAKYPGVIQGMAHMDVSKIKWIDYSDSGIHPYGTYATYYEGNDPAVIKVLADRLRSLEVKSAPRIYKYPPGDPMYRPAIGYPWTIVIHMDNGYGYVMHPDSDAIEVRSPLREDIFYQFAKPEQVEAMRRTMSQQKRTQLFAEFGNWQTQKFSGWSTTDRQVAEKIRSLTLQKAGRTYTRAEYDKMQPELEKNSILGVLHFSNMIEAGGCLFLPSSGTGQGLFWSNINETSAWYLTEKATQELAALMQPITPINY